MSRAFVVACAVVLVAVNLPALGPGGGGDALAAALEFDRRAIAEGEIWRLVTGHVAHWGREHAALDLAAFLALLPLAGAKAGARALLLGTAAIGAVLVVAGPDVYRGSSALSAALFTCAASQALRETGAPRMLGVAGLLAMLAKVAIEAHSGEAIFLTACAGPAIPAPAPVAHLAGALAGVFAGACRRQGSRGLPAAPEGARLAPAAPAPVGSGDGSWWQ